MSNSTHTVSLHRVLRAPAERVYRASSTPTRWANGCRRTASPARSTRCDAEVGGSYRMSFANFGTGKSHSFGGDVRRADAGRAHQVHGHVRGPEPAGRDARHDHAASGRLWHGAAIVQEGVPAAIPAEMCYLGWQESLRALADLVEAEIPDGE